MEEYFSMLKGVCFFFLLAYSLIFYTIQGMDLENNDLLAVVQPHNDQDYQKHLELLNQYIFSLLIDNIPQRSFEENLVMFHKQINNIEIYNNVHVDFETHIALFRKKLIIQGCNQHYKVLHEIAWQDEEIYKNVLRDVFVAKIMHLNLFPKASENIKEKIEQDLKEAVEKLDVTEQLDVLNVFSRSASIIDTITTYKELEQSILKKAVKKYVFSLCKEYLKQKMPHFAFVLVSVMFWYLWPTLEKKYSKDILYLYEALAIILLNDYVRAKPHYAHPYR